MSRRRKRDDTSKDPRNPSEVLDDYWIFAEDLTGNYDGIVQENRGKGRAEALKSSTASTSRFSFIKSGKWMIFVDRTEVDKWWAVIKKAIEEGRLGDSAKVSTARPNPNAVNADKSVIIVYTNDWTDETDVMRIRDELRNLGVTWGIPYKSDEDTFAGKYRVRGNTRISKYYC